MNFAPSPVAPQTVDSWHLTAFSAHKSRDQMQSANLDITLIDPLSGSEWDDLLSTHPDTTIFHTSAWARVLARTYGHRPFYLHFTRRGRSVALLPLMEVASRVTGSRGVCLPFSDFCAPLLFGDGGGDVLLAQLLELAAERNWNHVELRGGVPAPVRDGVAATFYGHTLDLSGGEEALFARFNSSVHRAIRKAERSGVSVDILRTRDAMREFYRLHCQTRRRHGVPPQPFAFFRHIQEEIIASGCGFIAVAKSGARCIAAAVFFRLGGRGLFKFGASEKSHQNLRPNNLVMWEGMRYLLLNGCRSLHFGRTAPDDAGLRRFKLSWNTREESFHYVRLNPISRLFVPVQQTNSSALYQKLFTKLPLALNVLAGKLIYPHLD
jgi:CelD/BcsL family acetyltransferase involved in cellulose biosynthesis